MEHKIYQSKLVEENHLSFVKNCSLLYEIIQDKFNTNDTTWNYRQYNVFLLTMGSILFFKLFKELSFFIRDYLQNSTPIGMNSWLNYHVNDDQLQTKLGDKVGFHSHGCDYHGYISIDPQNTITKFRNNLEIQNKIGQIYLGPSNSLGVDNYEYDHYVKLCSPSSNPRITIAFDIYFLKNHHINSNSIPII